MNKKIFFTLATLVGSLLSIRALALDLKLSNSATTEAFSPEILANATTDTIEISNFSGYGLALKSCNDTLSRLSLLSNDNVQITGQCTEDGLYKAHLKARVTIIK